ncbi:MAG: hypothetical protein ABIO55_09480 [Ginsengibacter sp.]
MSTENLKKELHTLIDNTEDEELLSMVKEELVAYQTGGKEFDDMSDLSLEQRAELEELATEEPVKDTISYEEHKKEMKEWLSKL